MVYCNPDFKKGCCSPDFKEEGGGGEGKYEMWILFMHPIT